ncbi:MAG: hypothetical protein LBD29_02025 [Treponema sp.]|jgi:tetratricopeptide (TPR) repeat protein|nr:hypothetical protein [Treponema sp.]
MTRTRFLVVWWLAVVFGLQGQTRNDPELVGDRVIAEKYAVWAKTAIEEGRWAEALAGLERGSDFSTVSSDIAYLLGLARSHENRPRGAVLEAVNYALETNHWNSYTPLSAVILKAETLIQIRRYTEALSELAGLPQTVDTLYLRLLALKGLNDKEGFSKILTKYMDAYPRDPRGIRVFFEYAADWFPIDNERELMTLVLKRLPLLVQGDRELAYVAAPFISDIEEARRILGAYRAIPAWADASIPIALNLGLIDGNDGVDQLFKVSPGEEKKIDKSLIIAVWNLLRDNLQRDRFKENLLRFSGVITEDANKDGYPEAQVWYKEGILTKYVYDPDQDGLSELTMFFEGGVPVRMELVVLPDPSIQGKGPVVYPPTRDDERLKATLQWEQYPAVLETKLQDTVYIPKPFDFFFFPIYFTKLEGGGLLYPERNLLMTEISRSTLAFSSLFIERPSREFPGAIEQIALDQGIPQKIQEFAQGRLVSETAFHLGKPVSQRIDLDGNGYLETTRYFFQLEMLSFYTIGDGDNPIDFKKIIEFSESDWDEDGVFEYREQYIYNNENPNDFDSYTALRFWDLDRDGVLEFSDHLRYGKP